MVCHNQAELSPLFIYKAGWVWCSVKAPVKVPLPNTAHHFSYSTQPSREETPSSALLLDSHLLIKPTDDFARRTVKRCPCTMRQVFILLTPPSSPPVPPQTLRAALVTCPPGRHSVHLLQTFSHDLL